MNTLISAKELRASLPSLVQKVRHGARFTVLYRSRPAFQLVPVDATQGLTSPLISDPLYKAKPVVHSTDGSAADLDALLYGK